MDQPDPKPAPHAAKDPARQPGQQLPCSPVDLLADCGDSSIYVVVVRCLSEGCFTGSAAMALLATLFMQVTLLALLLSAGRLDASDAAAAASDPLQLGDVDLVAAQLRVLQLAACATQHTLLQTLDNTSQAADALLPGCEGLLAAHNITASSNNNSSGGEAAGWADSGFISATYTALKSGGDNSGSSNGPPHSSSRLVSAVLSRLFPGAGNNAVVTFFAVSLALGILAIFVLREAQQACQLALVVAVLLGCAPAAWTKAAGVSSSSSSGDDNSSSHAAGDDDAAAGGGEGATYVATRLRSAGAWVRLAAALVPLLQLAMSLMTFATAALLMTWVSYREAVIDIVINSVALGFIVDLDDVMGALLAPALARHTATHPLPGGTGGSGCCYAVFPATGGRRRCGLVLQVVVVGAMAALVFAVLFAPVLVMLESMVPLVPVNVLATTAAVHFSFIFFFGCNLINLAPLHPLVDQSNKLQLGCVVGYIAAVAVASAVTVLAFLLSPSRRSGGRSQPSPQAPGGAQPECRNVTYCDPPVDTGNDTTPGDCYNVTHVNCTGGSQAGRPGMSASVGIGIAAVLGVLLLVAALVWAAWAWLRESPRSRGVGDDGGGSSSARRRADLPAEACDD